ncbi:MAG: PIG-L deacetylase family protein [bacterium]
MKRRCGKNPSFHAPAAAIIAALMLPPLLPVHTARAGAGGGAAEKETKEETVLYVFAHQDDEVCIAARMRSDVAAGRRVEAVWTTRGDKSGDPEVREKEARAAMAFVGVPDSALHFLGFEDQNSHATLVEAYLKTLEIALKAQPDEVFSNAYEGGNIDHDAAHFVAAMVSRALPDNPPHYEFPLYNSYRGTYQVAKFIPREGVETLYTPLTDELVDVKIKMLDFYPSQKAITGILASLVNRKQLKRTGEPYRRVPAYDYLEPPTDGVLGYELPANRTPHAFADFRQAVADFYNSPHNPAGAGGQTAPAKP